MKNALLIAALAVSSFALAAPAPAKAPAAPAAITAGDCDMHKAEAAMMKEMMADKVKMEMIKLDNGTTGIMTTDAAHSAAVEKAMGAMGDEVKVAMEGKAKLCDECKGHMAMMKAGKVMGGMGHSGMVWTHTMLSNDAEIVKKMHSDMDAKMAAMAPAPAK